MKAKDYLNRLRLLAYQIRYYEDEIAKLKDQQGRVKAFDYSGVKVQTSVHGDANLNLAIEIYEIELELEQELVKLTKERSKITRQISSLSNPKYVEVLIRKYCKFMTLEEISCEMNYSLSYVKNLHKNALVTFEKKYLKSSEYNMVSTF